MFSTQIPGGVIPHRVGRRQRWTEEQTARFRSGTLARIDAVLRAQPREYRTDFIAEAVELLLSQRETTHGPKIHPATQTATASAPEERATCGTGPDWLWLVGADQDEG